MPIPRWPADRLLLWLSWHMLAMQVPARRISSIYYTLGLKNGLQSTTLYTIYSLANWESSVHTIFFSLFLSKRDFCSLVLFAKCKIRRLTVRSFKQLLGRLYRMLCTIIWVVICTAGITKPHEIITYCLSVCFFLYVSMQ